MKKVSAALVVLVAGAWLSAQQTPQFSNAVRGFVKHAEPVIVLANARVIDGTGAPAAETRPSSSATAPSPRSVTPRR